MPAQARLVMAMLIADPGAWLSFREIVASCDNPYGVIGRFLGLLELFRERAIAFKPPEALGELKVSWTSTRAGQFSPGRKTTSERRGRSRYCCRSRRDRSRRD